MRCYVCLREVEFLFPLYTVQLHKGEMIFAKYDGVCVDCHEQGFCVVLRRRCSKCGKKMFATLVEDDRITCRCPKCGKETTFKRK